ncbi:MAG: thiolase family protein [Deltaproteobacteria bacterium]|nr:MAG: thiolase family protein [Deltaproteobacteria bacterium]
MTTRRTKRKGNRAVVVDGARTPFVRAFNEYLKMDTIDLGVQAVGGLLKKTKIAYEAIDAVVWGGVILPILAPNVGREIVLDLGLPRTIPAHTVTRACASGLQAITDAVAMIERGEAEVVIAGGSDSTSNAEVPLPRKLMQTVGPVAMNAKAGISDWLGAIGKLAPFVDLLPRKPKIAERTTGEVMGEAAEKMARINGITREAQDAFAYESHRRAAAAIASGRFDDEVVAVTTPEGKRVTRDTIVRPDTSIEKLGRLRPAFAKGGTVTAGNASPLTDGAACVLLMSERRAEKLGFAPRAFFRSWAYVGVDPADQLLMGPALAMPKALERSGLTFEEIDLFDLHEAFAAQVLAVVGMMADPTFIAKHFGERVSFGAIPPERLNVHGGSVALGHPFGATGARIVLTMANELARTDAKHALIGICAAGGLGAGAVMSAY